jgi:hypothetical protein
MYLLKTDGTTEEIKDTSLEGMQNAVGGWIEIVQTIDGKEMVVNEEGKMKNLPHNQKATKMAKIHPNDYIVGDVIIAEKGEIK